MSIVGNWTLHFDWGCDGSYSQVGMTFNSDGTFNLGSYTGKWVQVEGMIIFQFNASSTTYAGNAAGNSITGLMSTFSGLNGCFYALKSSSTTMLAAERKPEYDEAGETANWK